MLNSLMFSLSLRAGFQKTDHKVKITMHCNWLLDQNTDQEMAQHQVKKKHDTRKLCLLMCHAHTAPDP